LIWEIACIAGVWSEVVDLVCIKVTKVVVRVNSWYVIVHLTSIIGVVNLTAIVIIVVIVLLIAILLVFILIFISSIVIVVPSKSSVISHISNIIVVVSIHVYVLHSHILLCSVAWHYDGRSNIVLYGSLEGILIDEGTIIVVHNRTRISSSIHRYAIVVVVNGCIIKAVVIVVVVVEIAAIVVCLEICSN